MNLGGKTGKSTWQTPPRVLDALRAAQVPIDLDPATSAENPTRARLVYSPEPPVGDVPIWLGEDGLSEPWPAVSGLFLNPPWAKGLPVDPWVERVTEWVWATRYVPGVASVLVPASLNAAWFHDLVRSVEADADWRTFAFSGRLAYIDPDTGEERKGCQFESVLVAARWTVDQQAAFQRAAKGRWL